MAMRRTWAMALRRPSTPSRSSCSKACAAAVTASSTALKTPLEPVKVPAWEAAVAAGVRVVVALSCPNWWST